MEKHIRRIVEFNVLTGKEAITEIEMTEEEIAVEQVQIDKSEKERRIQEIKIELQQGDWRTVRHAELVEQGLSDEGYTEFIANRAALREEINALEAELAA